MNLNNMYGTCCKCPALMDDSRLFTTYLPRKSLNEMIMVNMKATDNVDYRMKLEQNGENIIKNMHNYYVANAVCKNNNSVKFYEDKDINKLFDDAFKKNLK